MDIDLAIDNVASCAFLDYHCDLNHCHATLEHNFCDNLVTCYIVKTNHVSPSVCSTGKIGKINK